MNKLILKSGKSYRDSKGGTWTLNLIIPSGYYILMNEHGNFWCAPSKTMLGAFGNCESQFSNVE